MVAVHTVLTRWLNSIYLQAPHIPEAERKNFIIYAKYWANTLHHHHTGEETFFFPDVEAVCQLPGIMQRNVEQHHVFEDGIKRFIDHLNKLEDEPELYDGAEILKSIDVFAGPLMKHLDEEIQTLVSIPDQLPPGLKPIDVPYKEMADRSGKRATNGMNMTDLYGFLANHDRSYVAEYLHNFPPVPMPVKMLMGYIMPFFNDSIFKFSSCDLFGQPKDLPYAPTKQ
jgi:hypothetical protein